MTAGELDDLGSWALAGQLLVVGFDGTELPHELERGLALGERAGVVLFRRNIAPEHAGLVGLQRLCAAIRAASGPSRPALIAIDEEGGRVARLGPPALKLPPMRKIAELGDVQLVRRIARAVGDELRCLGLTMNFAPVVDVDTNPDNPIIGDRSFAREPERVAAFAEAYLRGLSAAGIQSCLKHYPGHGDTLIDSHLGLPTVSHPRERLMAVELLPFRRLAQLADSMMTAHVVYPELDASQPATLSRYISTELLREDIAFQGVLFSDDLEMQAIAGHSRVEDSAVAAVRAGCDLLLICSRSDLQQRAHRALSETIDIDAQFRARCVEAASRGLELRRRGSLQPISQAELDAYLTGELPRLDAELRERLALEA